jgi:hypothetical protein
MSQLFVAVDELEEIFHGRHVTIGGHLVGSIGEAIAAHCDGSFLLGSSTDLFHACTSKD